MMQSCVHLCCSTVRLIGLRVCLGVGFESAPGRCTMNTQLPYTCIIAMTENKTVRGISAHTCKSNRIDGYIYIDLYISYIVFVKTMEFQ